MRTNGKNAKHSTREMLIGLGFDAELLEDLLDWYRKKSDPALRDEFESLKSRLKSVHDGLTNVAGKIKRLGAEMKRLAVERPGLYVLDGQRLDEYFARDGRPAMYNPRDFQRWHDEISCCAENLRKSSSYFAEEAGPATSEPIRTIAQMCRHLASRRVTYKELADLLNEELGDMGPANNPVTEEAVRQQLKRLNRALQDDRPRRR